MADNEFYSVMETWCGDHGTTRVVCWQMNPNAGANESRRRRALIEVAKNRIRQWDNHDKYRELPGDLVLYDPDLGEPAGIAMARAILELLGNT